MDSFKECVNFNKNYGDSIVNFKYLSMLIEYMKIKNEISSYKIGFQSSMMDGTKC